MCCDVWISLEVNCSLNVAPDSRNLKRGYQREE